MYNGQPLRSIASLVVLSQFVEMTAIISEKSETKVLPCNGVYDNFCCAELSQSNVDADGLTMNTGISVDYWENPRHNDVAGLFLVSTNHTPIFVL